ncbi:hypothetical protein BN14_06514 [Rhizoctonia solani AG-1 IB]|uniref:Uncharacterized protein n=1 Tax=Thanatephorus cucumeris (strain AG1-IB / isolate 7/3/14) TaxID=1108050 RepID=M5BZ16_THACB|nr:hypothetical protein BN14_06514 [Rhizoctonia solani AG-1 IB]
MYKRINKRIRKKEKEEELGLDDETKEILGMQDTDSDESDSSEEEQTDDGSEEYDTDGEEKLTAGRNRGGLNQLSDSGGSDAESLSEVEMEDQEEAENEEITESEEDEPPMTVSEALGNPLYSIQKGSDVQRFHLESSSHLRRAKRFATLAARVGDEEEDPRLLVIALDESTRIVPRETSIRVSDEPKVSKKDRRMAKRGRRKERRATKQTDEQARVKSVPKTQSGADRVLERKLVNRHSEAIAKHKLTVRTPVHMNVIVSGAFSNLETSEVAIAGKTLVRIAGKIFSF